MIQPSQQPESTCKPGEHFQIQAKVDSRQQIIEALQAHSHLSKRELKRALTCGAVRLHRPGNKAKRIRKGSFLLQPGDTVSFFYDRALLRKTADIPVCLNRHRDYSIWYKQPEMVTQGTGYGDHLCLLRIVEQQLQLYDRIFPVHRLDREACGIVLVAHDKRSCAALSKQFREQTVEKKYWARVEGRLEPENMPYEIERRLDGKPSRTIITSSRHCREDNVSELFITLKTGRHHQIRRHLSAVGHPLVGDRRYNRHKTAPAAHLQLCAYQLCFTEPASGKRINATLPPALLPF